jgi:hypothetical protein
MTMKSLRFWRLQNLAFTLLTCTTLTLSNTNVYAKNTTPSSPVIHVDSSSRLLENLYKILLDDSTSASNFMLNSSLFSSMNRKSLDSVNDDYWNWVSKTIPAREQYRIAELLVGSNPQQLGTLKTITEKVKKLLIEESTKLNWICNRIWRGQSTHGLLPGLNSEIKFTSLIFQELFEMNTNSVGEIVIGSYEVKPNGQGTRLVAKNSQSILWTPHSQPFHFLQTWDGRIRLLTPTLYSKTGLIDVFTPYTSLLDSLAGMTGHNPLSMTVPYFQSNHDQFVQYLDRHHAMIALYVDPGSYYWLKISDQGEVEPYGIFNDGLQDQKITVASRSIEEIEALWKLFEEKSSGKICRAQFQFRPDRIIDDTVFKTGIPFPKEDATATLNLYLKQELSLGAKSISIFLPEHYGPVGKSDWFYQWTEKPISRLSETQQQFFQIHSNEAAVRLIQRLYQWNTEKILNPEIKKPIPFVEFDADLFNAERVAIGLFQHPAFRQGLLNIPKILDISTYIQNHKNSLNPSVSMPYATQNQTVDRLGDHFDFLSTENTFQDLWIWNQPVSRLNLPEDGRLYFIPRGRVDILYAMLKELVQD